MVVYTKLWWYAETIMVCSGERGGVLDTVWRGLVCMENGII